MLNRNAIPPDALAELGYLTIAYSGLEELLIGITAALLNSEDQESSRDLLYDLMFSRKVNALRGLFRRRCEQSNCHQMVQAMNKALKACDTASAKRNDLVHGLVVYDNGVAFICRPKKGRQQVTTEQVKAVNGLILRAYAATIDAFHPFWNTTKGRFT